MVQEPGLAAQSGPDIIRLRNGTQPAVMGEKSLAQLLYGEGIHVYTNVQPSLTGFWQVSDPISRVFISGQFMM